MVKIKARCCSTGLFVYTRLNLKVKLAYAGFFVGRSGLKKEFIDLVIDISPAIFIVSILSSWLKGVRSFLEYLKALIASFITGIPAACLAEHYLSDPMIKYTVVLSVGAFGICLFNGLFKIFKGFEQDPVHTIKEIKRDE